MSSPDLNLPPVSQKADLPKRRRNSDISGLLVFFFVVIGIIFVMSVAFRVSNIVVEGNEHYTDREIINAIDIEDGDNLFFFDRFGAISRVFAKLPYVEEISVERILPNKVVIRVTESKALAYIPIGDELWTMDRNCKILGKAAEGEEGTMIPISGINPGTLMIGEPLTVAEGSTSPVELLSAVLDQLQERGMYHNARKIFFTSDGKLKMQYTDKYTVIIGDATDIERKFSLLVSAVSQLTEGDVGVIDVSDGASIHFSPN